MKNDSLAEIIRENFLKDYSFLLEENWFDGEAPPQLLSGKINMNPKDAAEFLYMLEATSYKEQQGKIKKYTPSEKKLYARYNLEKNRGRFKPFPILRSDSFKKTARITKPAVIKLLIFVLLSFIFNPANSIINLAKSFILIGSPISNKNISPPSLVKVEA